MEEALVSYGTLNSEFLLLGLPTWCLMQGSFGILYKLVDTQPEGFDISTYVMTSLTLGNIFALYFGNTHQKLLYEKSVEVIACLLVAGLLTGIGLAICWWWTINGTSFPLFVLMFCGGLVSATSNIALFTFVFSPRFLNHKVPGCTAHGEATALNTQGPAGRTTALATGMALGSGFSGLLALTQGQIALSTPNNSASVSDGSGFSVSVFFCILSALYGVALYALFLLWRRGHNRKSSYDDNEKARNDVSGPLLGPSDDDVNLNIYGGGTPVVEALSTTELQLMALLVFTGMMGFGVVPSVISGVCGKFRHGSNTGLLFATCIACVGDPFSRALTSWVYLQTLSQLVAMATLCAALTAALLVLFALPGNSEVFGGLDGAALPASLYVAFTFCFGFLNTSAFVYINHGDSADKQRLSRLASMAMQAGAFCGAVVMFIFVITDVL